MSKCKTRLTIVAVLAVVANTFVPASPTLAQTDGRRPSAPVAGRAPELPKPEVFVPGAPTLTADDAALLAEAAAPGAPLALRRPSGGQVQPSQTTTAMSRHSVDADGKGTAELYTQPAFRRSAGGWVEVDSTLRPTSRADQPVAAEGALRPVRFGTSAERIVELGLDQGPVTLSSLGLNLGQPSLEGSTVTYNDVAPDTDLRYVVGDDGVKEELVLHSASAPRSFIFHLADPSGQLGTPTRDEAGAWTFPNPIEEGVVLTMPPALVWEQSAEGQPVASDPASANLELVAAGDGWDLTVSVSDAWLEGKSFPVVLDPTLTYSANYGNGPTLEGYALRQDGGCGGSCFLTRDANLYAGSWAPYNPARSFVRYDLSDIPEDARIDSATFRIYNSSCMVARTPDPCATKSHYIGLHRMVDNWYSSSRYDELAADTASSPFTPWIQRSAGTDPGYHFWTDGLTAQVQRWVNRSDPNYGFAIRSLDETPDEAGAAYVSSRATTTSRRPSLSVSYTVVVPGSPGVAAYAGNGAARVHWGIPNSGGAAIDHYLVKTYRSGTYVSSKTVTCPCPTVATVEGLANGTSYSFSVQAHNSVGYSAAATSPSVTPSAAFPTSPSPASASPGNAAARVDWSHPSTGAAAVDHYIVQAYDTDTGYLGAVTITCPCPTTAPVGVLANGDRYILAVFAHNEAGYGAPSISSSVVPASNRPGPPRTVVAQAAPRAVDVSWQAAPTTSGGSSISSYTVRPYDALSGYLGDAKAKTITCPCGTTAARIDGLAPGRTYVFAVIATTANGSGAPGLGGPAQLANVPGAPTSLAAVPGNGRAALSWEASGPNGSPVTGYTITASPGGATTPAPGDATSAMFEGLANGTAYTFTAVATNAVGDSTASLRSNEVTPSADRSLLSPLVDPSDVVATRGDTTARVTWDRPLVTLPLLTTFEVATFRASDGAVLGTTDAGTGDSVIVRGLKNGTPVYFTVTAKSLLLSGTSEPSNTVTPAGPPFAPTEVVATRGDRQVEVSWNPPGPREDGTPGDNGEPISSYTISAFRADDNTEVSTTEASASPMIVGGLVNGTSYYFTVHATNEIGAGQESVPSNAVTPAGAPFAPVDVTATTAGNGEARVSWSPPPTQSDGTPGDNGDPIVRYRVRTNRGGPTVTVDAPTTSEIIGGLDPGTSYTFTVSAINGVREGPESVPSNSVAITGPPDPPTGVNAVVDEGTATVRWLRPAQLNGSTLTGYIVTATPVVGEGSEISVTVDDPAATSATVSGLVGGTTYEFRVVATSDRGNSEPSQPATGTPEGEPGAPSGLQAVPGDGQVVLSWVGPSDVNGSSITGYEISVDPECSPACTNVSTAGPTITSATVGNGLTNATTYTFRVRAKSTAGPGPYSAPVDAIPHRPTYVAMGDSYSSGVGADDENGNEQPSGPEDQMCQRSDEAYGPLYHAPQASAADLVFLACGGGVTGDPRSPAEGTDSLGPIYKFLGDGGQISRLPVYADLVSFTIGGNDVNFSAVIKDCFDNPFEDCNTKYRAGGTNDEEAKINSMRPILADLYRAILDRSPNARVAVLTYPQLITETDDCFEQEEIALSDDEKKWIRDRTEQLAGVIRDAINDVGDSRLILVDELGRFADDGHGICADEGDRFANGLVTDKAKFGMSFHPTAAGYRRLAEDLVAKVGADVR